MDVSDSGLVSGSGQAGEVHDGGLFSHVGTGIEWRIRPLGRETEHGSALGIISRGALW